MSQALNMSFDLSSDYAHTIKPDVDLVWISNSNTPRKLVRSHIARNTHAKVRRKRAIEYNYMRRCQHGERLDKVSEEDRILERSFAVLAAADATIRRCRCARNSLTLDNPLQYQVTDQFATDWAQIGIITSPHRIIPTNHHTNLASDFEAFLMDYYIHTFLNDAEDNYHPYQCAISRNWLPVAIANTGMRMAMFLCACRSLHARTSNSQYYQSALRYKSSCLSLLSHDIQAVLAATKDRTRSPVKDTTISTVLQLASDEFIIGDSIAWKSHINAVSQMVKLNGGIENVHGMNGFLRQMIEVVTSKRDADMAPAGSSRDTIIRLCTLKGFFGG
ncbi:hypothetical protein F5Y04DRAFT_33643 [Hypomontagnella monticulosa]|nr:hypothetical protein F5Y04DRAFT_33643 [Hypomontagnella monticulosa]